MEQGENEEELLQCMMCTNQVPEEFLRRHIKFHHMIQKEEAIKKVYQMHLPEALVSVNTQTYVSWIDTLENIEESIVNIENHAESNISNDEDEAEVQLIEDNSSLSDTDVPDVSYIEEEAENTNQKIHPSHPTSTSKTHKIANQMNNLISKGTLTVTKVKEDEDEPIIIAEKKTDKFISKSSFPINQVKINKDKEQMLTKDLVDSCIRYKCPYCDFKDLKRYVVNDHVIIQHTTEGQTKNKCKPMYGEARKQEMKVGILKDQETINHLEKYIINEIHENGVDLKETKGEEVFENEEEIKSIEDNNWEKTDATLPNEWLFRDKFTENGVKETIFLSPCKQTFSSREEISEFLLDKGEKMIKTTGFKVPDVKKSKCNAMCEGKCKVFIVPKSFYHPKDRNKNRKKTKLKYISETEIAKANKARDKMVKRVPKVKLVKGIKYGAPVHKGTRPWIVLIEETPPKVEKNIELTTEKVLTEEKEGDKIEDSPSCNMEKHRIEVCEKDKHKLTHQESVQSSETGDSDGYDKGKSEMEKIEEYINLTNKDILDTGNKQLDIESNSFETNKESSKTERDKIKEKEMIAICTLNENIFLGSKFTPAVTISTVKEPAASLGSSHATKPDLLHQVKTDLEELSTTNEITEFYNTYSDIEVVQNTFEESSFSKRGRDQASPSRHQSPVSKKMKASDPKVIVVKENSLGLSDLMYNRNSPVKEMPKVPVRSFQDDEKDENKFYENLKRPQKNDSDSENELNKKRNIEKLKRLQKKEIEVNKNEGTYVQCCDVQCLKWRLVKEFEDPSMVPDYWICTMNSDPHNNICGEGGHSFMSDSEAVDVKFTCGSMVWAKMQGYPWWPGMVDYCPDSEEFYWIEESTSMTEPAWYHVVFFEGKGNQVSRAWVKSDLIMKITLPIDPPKNNIKSRETKVRLVNAVRMATDAKKMSREERLEKYSFAALFNGKWGIYSDIESDNEAHSGKKRKSFKSGLEGPSKDNTVQNPISKSPLRSTVDTSMTNVVLVKKKPGEPVVNVTSEEKRTTISLSPQKQMITKIVTSPNKKASQHFAQSKFLPHRGIDQDKGDVIESDRLKKFKHRSPKKLEIEKHRNTESFLFSVDHCYSKLASGSTSPKKSTILENLKYVNKALEDAQRKNFVQDKEISFENPNLAKHHPKPPLPSDVLIALSVRNLDPSNHFGASFNSIIAFLSLHFPYYNRNVEECKEMVRKAYDINTREETGKENFRIKNTLIEQLSVRINSYVDRNRALVKKSMLISELLETFMDRFLNGNGSNQATNFKPPFSCKMIGYLALISVSPPSSFEQLMLFITFLFPSLQNDKTTFKKQDFEVALQRDEHIEVYYLATTQQKMFILREGSYPIVLQSVRQYFVNKNNMIKLRKSITRQDIINILLPNLTA